MNCDVQVIEVDGHKVVRYAVDAMERVFAGKTNVEKDIKASVFRDDDAYITDPETISAITQELGPWLWGPKGISAVEWKQLPCVHPWWRVWHVLVARP